MAHLSFASDYQEGAHPKIIDRLVKTNMEKTAGYGFDEYTLRAKAAIKRAIENDKAQVYFMVGGTQVNKTVIDAMLKPYEGVISADSGHISVHEAGAIEYGGHKILTLSNDIGKIKAEDIAKYCKEYYRDENREHMVMPGLVYLSQPTEFGTLYSHAELVAIREVCDTYHMRLYVDGARLAYAFGASQNDVSLKDLAALCDAFYIGGTKCGTLFGEALVLKDEMVIPHLFTIIKQHGALLAKGRMLGLQFLAMFEDGLYMSLGQKAIYLADKIRQALKMRGYRFAFESPTNQIFIVVDDNKMQKLAEDVAFSFWEKVDDDHTCIRLVTSWSTTEAEVDELIKVL